MRIWVFLSLFCLTLKAQEQGFAPVACSRLFAVVRIHFLVRPLAGSCKESEEASMILDECE